MSLLAASHLVTQFVAAEDPTQTKSAIFPEGAEILYGLIAFGVVAFVLIKFAIPAGKKAMAARTERIQKELDGADAALASAKTESEQIRQAKGDIDGERARLLADADAQAEALLADGRARFEQEVAELDAKADADIAALATRSGDELRTDIAELASQATERLVVDELDDATAQALVEQFIQKVGAGR
jgi:F-type H+-transporting ATPase subunit b